jgi:starch synthase
MKAGIELADKLSTVSRKYAEEIQSDPARGMGLEGALRNRKDDISGIINGIDYDEWNPEQDPLIPAHFSAEKLSGKSECKKHLLQLFGLPLLKKRIPLVGIVSRLDDQKGFDLIEEAAEEILSLDLQMVILGTGRPKYHALFERLVSQYPKKISARLIFDNDLAHKIEAGCDLFLMPSRFEPCGLNQLYSLRYGTIPVVRSTGGLADTIEQYDGARGTGFCFSEYSAKAMMASLRQAISAYSNPYRWNKLVANAMSQDWSWDRSAREYINLYNEILQKRQVKA